MLKIIAGLSLLCYLIIQGECGHSHGHDYAYDQDYDPYSHYEDEDYFPGFASPPTSNGGTQNCFILPPASNRGQQSGSLSPPVSNGGQQSAPASPPASNEAQQGNKPVAPYAFARLNNIVRGEQQNCQCSCW